MLCTYATDCQKSCILLYNNAPESNTQQWDKKEHRLKILLYSFSNGP